LIVVAALRQLGPEATAAQIRDFIANLTDFPGIDGIYNFKASPERGLRPDSAIAVTYDPAANAWVWLTKPGGTPLN
jgi:branched-chain amino acid transport system substrate-binding protein